MTDVVRYVAQDSSRVTLCETLEGPEYLIDEDSGDE